MTALELVGAGYAYAAGPGAGPIDLRLEAAERVLVCGPSGSGKSTLLRLAAGLASRFGDGTARGRVRAAGRDPAALPPRDRPATVAFVSQEPTDQLLAGTVADELAFGPESAGWGAARVGAAIEEGVRAAGLDGLEDRDPRSLSGGQQQRLVVAAALAVGSPLLLLDEPLSQLDPGAVQRLLELLTARTVAGVCAVMVEHRLERALPWCTRAVVLEGGVVVFDGAPEALSTERIRALGLRLPGARAAAALQPAALPPPAEPAAPAGAVVCRAKGLRHSYGDRVALHRQDVELRAGERVAVLGRNGAGKSTLLALLGGAHGARVTPPGLLVPQEPDLSLFCATVGAELAYGPRERRVPPAEVRATVEELAAAFALRDLEQPPQAQSRGQRLRVAVAAALACRPSVLLLDEPTAGQDHHAVEGMLAALRRHLGAGALVFATHDLDLALRHATRVWVLDEGRRVFDGTPEAFLHGAEPLLPLPELAAWCRSRRVDYAAAAAAGGG